MIAAWLLALGAGQPAAAADWKFILAETGGQYQWFGDTQSVRRGGDEVELWTQRRATRGGKLVDRTFYRIDCADETAAPVSGVTYGKQEEVTGSFSYDDDHLQFDPIVPDSVMDHIKGDVCPKP